MTYKIRHFLKHPAGKSRWLLFFLFALSAAVCPLSAQTEPPAGTETGGIRVRVDVEKVKIYFNGEIEGLTHPRKPLVREYLPPGQITVTAKPKNFPEQSKTVTVSPGHVSDIRFRLRPPPPHLAEWVKKGDAHLKAGDLAAPKGKNAFEMYRKVLTEDPGHPHARRQIFKILNRLEKKGAASLKNRDYSEARDLYAQFIRAGEFAASALNASELGSRLENAETELKRAGLLSRSVRDLLEAGDARFHRRRFLTPENDSAFQFYRAVLEKEPGNTRAGERIREMRQFYLETARKNEPRNLKRSLRFYENLAALTAFAAETAGDAAARKELGSVREKTESIARRIRAAEKLARKAEKHFSDRRYALPEKENAFVLYQEVLKNDPTHELALERLHEIMDFYHSWGEDAFDHGNYEKARLYFQQYLKVADFLSESFGSARAASVAGRMRDDLPEIAEISRFMEKALTFAAEMQFALPEEANALCEIQNALFLDPQHRHARNTLIRMTGDCFLLAEDAFVRKRYAEAENLYSQFLSLAEGVEETDIAFDMTVEREEAVRKQKELRLHLLGEALSRVRAAMEKKYADYRTLKEKEYRDINVTEQILPVIRAIVENLNEIETLYQTIARTEGGESRNGEMADKIRRLSGIRLELTEEIAVREGKIH